jgi:hypothetical protein
MQQESEISAWLWRLPLAALLWTSANVALVVAVALWGARTRETLVAVRLGGVTLDLIGLRELWMKTVLWSVVGTGALGLSVLCLTVLLRLAGRLSFAQPSARRALWLAGADAALPLALAAALFIHLRLHPPKLFF